MDIGSLVKLTSRAWALDILAAMHDGVPGRQATLLARTGAGRSSFKNSLEHLMGLGLLERTPGHGHPLRPEFRLTPAGIEAAATAHAITTAAADDPAHPLLRRTWTVPILGVSREQQRFSGIKDLLAPISDRALSQALKALHAAEWVRREVDPTSYPVRPLYVASGVGERIAVAAFDHIGTMLV